MADDTKTPTNPPTSKVTARDLDVLKELKLTEEEFLENKLRLNQRLTEEEKAQLSAKEQAIVITKDLLASRKQQLSALEKYTEGELAALGLQENIVDKVKEWIEELEKAAPAAQKFNERLAASNEAADQITKRLFGITGASKQMGAALENPVESLSKMGTRLKQNLTATNLLGSAALKVAEGFTKAATAVTDYMQKTYGVEAAHAKAVENYNDYRTSARDLNMLSQQELAGYISDTEKLADASAWQRKQIMDTRVEMRKSSAAFRQSATEDQVAATDLALLLERRLNVTVGNTAGQMEKLQLVQGKSSEEARKMTADFAVQAKTLGLDVNKAQGEYISQSNNLSKFGLPDMQREFFKLAHIQDKTGISMDSVISGMEKFSTFQGALEAAGKLNATFGTMIDGMEMAAKFEHEGPVGVMLLLKERAEEAGLELDKITSPSAMKQLTTLTGLQAEEVKMLGRVSMAQLQKIADPALSATDTYVELQKELGEYTTGAESSGKATDTSSKALKTLVEKQMEYQKGLDETISKLGILGSMLATGGAIIVGLGLLAGAWALLKRTTAGGWLMSAIGGLKSMGPAAASSAPGVAKLASGAGAAKAAAAAPGAKAAAAGASGFGAMGAAALTAAAAGGAFLGWGINKLGLNPFMEGEEDLTLSDYNPFGSNIFAPGQNYVSQPTPAIIGDSLGSETVTKRTQAALGAGDKVATNAPAAAAGPTELRLTVNLVTKEGKTLGTQDITQQIRPGILGAAVSAILDEKLNLIYG